MTDHHKCIWLDVVEPPRADAGPKLEIPLGQFRPFLAAELGSASEPIAEFESLLCGESPRLLVVFHQDAWREVMINGHRALPAELLEPGDLIRFPWGELVRVAIGFSPEVKKPGPEHMGRPCPICRLEIVSETRVYVCSCCGSAMHLEGNEVAEAQRLRCALISAACPCCSSAIPREALEGHAHVPAS